MNQKPLPMADHELSNAADLWAALADAAKCDKEAEAFLLAYGPWVRDRLAAQLNS